MLEQIPIFLSADDNYARYCAVTILSILKNTQKPEELHFYIFSPDITNENTRKIDQLCSSFNSNLSIIKIDLNLFKSLPEIEHVNLNTYTRLITPELSKINCNIILLDCDIIVLSEIADFYKYNLKTFSLGAIPHVQFPYQEIFLKKFEIQNEDFYFNAGVMLINGDTWQKNDYSDKTFVFASDNADKLQFQEQDALNAVFWCNYCHLPGEWNVEARLYKEKLLGLPQTEEITHRMKNAKIIHYTGPDKPWKSKNYVPMRHLYLYYSEMLSEEFGWLPSKPEPKSCSPLAMIKFIWSCIYFRTSYIFKKIFKFI
ncbi:glycosyltransferase family 8 protein [Picosynechococcus sp. PCC 7117]|uniref:glycosyltransferase family 8 protein n=1 Tax=Picosynechococcus sp. PCC 7117 TaxID=195498 RepID=UPI000810EB22|nr:glycosyltransferase family 8 protein [Picosynechococcus sp. PCC 7117]ANV87357.1 hypothetical protein AWQ22_07755 [Picosynechococcus sp. PCC 7117]